MKDKADLRREVKQQLADFVARGGKIDMLPYKDLAKEKKAKKKVTE